MALFPTTSLSMFGLGRARSLNQQVRSTSSSSSRTSNKGSSGEGSIFDSPWGAARAHRALIKEGKELRTYS